MKKLIPFAVVAALAIVPSSAMAVGTWDGWQNQHSDNVASPAYPTTFGNNGLGDSQYCVDPGTTSTHCGASVQNGGTAVYSPVVFAGELGGTTGCTHGTSGNDGSTNIVQSPGGPGPGNPCATPGGTGAFYLGFAGNNTDGNPSQPSPVDPGQGIIGLQH